MSEYDCVVIGGGHNGLVTAAYLGRAGRKVCVLEKRHILGECTSTEELVAGFKASPAAYVIMHHVMGNIEGDGAYGATFAAGWAGWPTCWKVLAALGVSRFAARPK